MCYGWKLCALKQLELFSLKKNIMIKRLIVVLMVLGITGCDGGPSNKIVWEKDGAEMVWIPELFIPAKFKKERVYDRIGNPVTKSVKVSEPVKIDAFYMDCTEVTVGQFKKFLRATAHRYNTGYWEQVYRYSPTDEHPMIYVSWHDAISYCNWAGKRLPTEVEWDRAARGGLVDKEYPWGDDLRMSRDYANYDGTGNKDRWDDQTAPVGRFAPNGYGLYDIIGNVWEWCADSYDDDQDNRVLRGGSWDNLSFGLRITDRSFHLPNDADNYFGFRCVAELSEF